MPRQPESADDLPEGPGEDDWLIVPNWSEFQHYKDRNPLWIKVYARLLQDPDYLGLSLASKGLLQVLWLAYSQSGEHLTIRTLRKLCRDRFGYPQLIALNHAGFLHWSASKPLATKKEKEKEKESPYIPLTDKDAERELLQRASDVASDWQGGTSDQFEEALDQLERRYERHLPWIQRSKLWDVALRHDHRLT